MSQYIDKLLDLCKKYSEMAPEERKMLHQSAAYEIDWDQVQFGALETVADFLEETRNFSGLIDSLPLDDAAHDILFSLEEGLSGKVAAIRDLLPDPPASERR